MLETVKKLIHLQELELTLDESDILHGEEHANAGEVKDEIAALRATIDTDALARYDRLARHGLAVVQLRGSMCTGCNMAVPQGDLNRMRTEKELPVCPNCGHYLEL